MSSITKREILNLAQAHDVIPMLATRGQGLPEADAAQAVENLAEHERQNIIEAMGLLSTAKRRKTPSRVGTYSLKHAVERLLPSGYVSHAAFVVALLASGFIVQDAPRSILGEKLVSNISMETTAGWYKEAYGYSSNRARA